MDFGAFVELDEDIHGLAHISELANKTIKNPDEVVTVGAAYTFKILSIEPSDHRLGLSLKKATARSADDKGEKTETERTAETVRPAADTATDTEQVKP